MPGRRHHLHPLAAVKEKRQLLRGAEELGCRLKGHQGWTGIIQTEEEVCIKNDLYNVLGLYVNFFQPSAKLVSKERIGPKVVKHYDTPKTPYQRLLESSCIDETKKNNLRQVWEILNPADLKRRIDRLKRKLERRHK